MGEIKDLEAGAEGRDNVVAGLEALATILGLRDKFLLELLLDKDDWSFGIKAHALLESVICTLLAMHLRRKELQEVLAEEVEMHARIEMTKALGAC